MLRIPEAFAGLKLDLSGVCIVAGMLKGLELHEGKRRHTMPCGPGS